VKEMVRVHGIDFCDRSSMTKMCNIIGLEASAMDALEVTILTSNNKAKLNLCP
jgi:hypothetical protein